MGQSLTEEQIQQRHARSLDELKLLFKMLDQAKQDMGRELTTEERCVVALAWDQHVAPWEPIQPTGTKGGRSE